VWSATSYKQLRDDALTAERWNRLHPTAPARRPYVTEALADADGPLVAVSDFVKVVPDQIARWVPQPFIPLGTDGFGLSDTRPALRRHFEVDAAHVAVAVLYGLAQRGDLKEDVVANAIDRYGIDTDALDPRDA
jgi:pyruvate dehydrogenase E1 component